MGEHALRSEALRLGDWPRRWAWVGLAAALVIYAAGLLWPFAVQVPTWVANEAAWTSAGTLRFEKPGLAVSPASPKWLETSRDLGRFHVSLRARAFSPQQDGPARLFTLARDTHAQNVVIGQAGDDLVVRLRGLCRRIPGRTPWPARSNCGSVTSSPPRRGSTSISWSNPTGQLLRAGSQPPLEMRIADQPLRGWDADTPAGAGQRCLRAETLDRRA